MPAVPGRIGALASLPPELMDRLRFHIDWYKANRASIVRSSARLLTPPLPVPNDSGWVGIQTDDPVSGIHRLFIFRLDDAGGTHTFIMVGLDSGKTYQITKQDGADFGRTSGRGLMDAGITVSLSIPMSAEILSVTAL